MDSFVARLWATWLFLHSTVEAAHQMTREAVGEHSDIGFGGYEEFSDTEIIILLSLAFACVVVFLIVGLALNRRTRQNRQRSSRRVVTAADVEEHFPTFYTEEEPTCAVCLSTVEVDEPCRRTQCGHEFHADCIMQWWTHKPRKVLRCPICRRRQHVKREQAEGDRTDPKLQLPGQQANEEEGQVSLEVRPLELQPGSPPEPQEQQLPEGQEPHQQKTSEGQQQQQQQQQQQEQEQEQEQQQHQHQQGQQQEQQQQEQPGRPLEEQPLQAPQQQPGGYPQPPSAQQEPASSLPKRAEAAAACEGAAQEADVRGGACADDAEAAEAAGTAAAGGGGGGARQEV